MKDRAAWQKKSYSHFWADQVVKYGFDDYCKGLCEMVEKKKPSSVYEMAIGTGWPFAITFYEKGIEVAGSDISELLIEELADRYPGIKANVASYENINPAEEQKYDVVYCFRSTWYFPNLIKALDTMFELAKKGGVVIFDIMNKDSDYIQNIIRVHKWSFALTICKNIIKKAANVLFGKTYLIQDPWNIHELPVSPKIIEQYLTSKNILFHKYSINQVTDGLEKAFVDHGKSNSKVIFECQVT